MTTLIGDFIFTLCITRQLMNIFRHFSDATLCATGIHLQRPQPAND